MDIEKIYNQVQEYLNKINFEALWLNFRPLKFALYNQNECFFNGRYIDKTDQFIANTSILFQDEYIAIWNLQEDIPIEILVSKIVHEMFHGFQMKNNEMRWANELEALVKYKYSDENLSIKLKENRLLNELLSSFDSEKYQRLLSLKRYRYEKYNYEYVYESRIQQIEGCANFVELMTLKQIAPVLYNEKIRRMKDDIVYKERFLPIRVIEYEIGALLIVLLTENGLGFETGFTDQPFGVSLIRFVNKFEGYETLVFEKILENYFQKAKNLMNRIISKNEIVEQEEFKLLGINVYNAIYVKPYIYTTYFAMYEKNQKRYQLAGNYVIEIDNGVGKKIYKE